MSEDDRQAFFTRMQEAGLKARTEFYAAVNGVLTADQKAKGEELMKNVPEYLTRRPQGPGAGNRQGGSLNFTPGQGVPGRNPNREQTPQQRNPGSRPFPG
jgi:hypothetical protein